MLRSAFSRVALALAVAWLGIVPLAVAAPDKPVVTVFAGASLREAFEDAAPAFTRATGYPVRFSFGGSDTLAAQLAQGAPADAFASANDAQMRRVAGLVETPRAFARNRLVVIVPKDGTAVTSLADLGKKGVKVVLAASSVPVGAYARRAFAALGNDRAYGEGFAARVAANVVSEETDVKAVATKIALGEGDAGVVYVTDAAALGPKARVLRFPAGVAPEAVYPVAVVKAAPNAAGGRAFVDFVTSAAGKAFLRAHGFEE